MMVSCSLYSTNPTEYQNHFLASVPCRLYPHSSKVFFLLLLLTFLLLIKLELKSQNIGWCGAVQHVSLSRHKSCWYFDLSSQVQVVKFLCRVLRGFPHAGTSKTCKKYNYYEDIVRKSELLPPMFLSLLEIKMLDRRYKHQDTIQLLVWEGKHIQLSL